MKRYVELEKNELATHLKIETRYDLGGPNWAYGGTTKRGYYLSVMPVTRENRNGYWLETYVGFTGSKQLLKEVTRKSAKAEATAEEIAKNYIHSLVEYVCESNNIPIPSEFVYPEVKYLEKL